MAQRTEDEYIFADAYIGCHVSDLMNKSDMVRLANCSDLPSADTLLQEFGYLECKETARKYIETFIRREQKNLYSLLFKNLVGREEMTSYLFPFDYHNIKVCLKSEFTGVTPDEDVLISTGHIDWKVMVAMIRDRNFSDMRPIMREAVEEAIDAFGRSGDPQQIDLVLDKACYRDMADHAADTGSEFIASMVDYMADVVNVKIFARLKMMGRPWTFFNDVCLRVGNIKPETFMAAYEEPFVQLADKILNERFSKAVREGGRILDETGDFAMLEKLLDDAVMEENKRAKYYSFGIEPIVGYWFAKEVEIDNIRIILNGILGGVKPDTIIDMLREPYV